MQQVLPTVALLAKIHRGFAKAQQASSTWRICVTLTVTRFARCTGLPPRVSYGCVCIARYKLRHVK